MCFYCYFWHLCSEQNVGCGLSQRTVFFSQGWAPTALKTTEKAKAYSSIDNVNISFPFQLEMKQICGQKRSLDLISLTFPLVLWPVTVCTGNTIRNNKYITSNRIGTNVKLSQHYHFTSWIRINPEKADALRAWVCRMNCSLKVGVKRPQCLCASRWICL